MDLNTFLFWLLALLTGLNAIAVVVSQNIVRAATWLLFALAGTSGIFFLLGADFVGATQLFVYVGGTLVLVVFGVMLTAQGPFISMKTGAAEWAVATIVGLVLFAVLTLSVLSFRPEPPRAGNDLIERLGSPKLVEREAAFQRLQAQGDLVRADLEQAAQNNSNPVIKERAGELLQRLERKSFPDRSTSSVVLGEAFLGMEQATPPGRLTGAPYAFPRQRTQMAYLLPFEIVSVHLLVVLVGAAYLARAKKRRRRGVP